MRTPKPKTTEKPQEKRFRVGQSVWLLMGHRPVKAEILEDRGPLGVGGRRLYRIKVEVAPGESSSFKLSADDLAAEASELELDPA